MFVIKATARGFSPRYLRPNKYTGSSSWAPDLQEARTFESEQDVLLVLANTTMHVEGGLKMQKVERSVSGMPWNVDEFVIKMDSDTSDSVYTICIAADRATCTCPDHKFRGRACKHIRRALDMLGMKALQIVEV